MKRYLPAFLMGLLLVGCATSVVVPPVVSTHGTHVRLMRTLGGALATPGIDQVAALVAKVPGVTLVRLYEYTEANQIAAEILSEPSTVTQVIEGGSCGANAATTAAARAAPHVIAMVAVIQPSMWCVAYETPLTPNVLQAQETFDPTCADTAGLGCKKLDIGPGFNPSSLTIIVRPDCHPCSFVDPDAQNDLVRAVRSVTLAKATYKRIPGEPNVPRVVVRYKGQPL